MVSRQVLYSRGESDADDRQWDDGELIDAYDRALSVARDQVAKRAAMRTNAGSGSGSEERRWKAGAACRAVYDEDGVEYEATVVEVSRNVARVAFVGYGNEQRVAVDELAPSRGERERARQANEAKPSRASVCDERFDEEDAPAPPPPPLPPFCVEDRALSSVLVSWYMTGYYTGLYEGRRRANK